MDSGVISLNNLGWSKYRDKESNENTLRFSGDKRWRDNRECLSPCKARLPRKAPNVRRGLRERYFNDRSSFELHPESLLSSLGVREAAARNRCARVTLLNLTLSILTMKSAQGTCLFVFAFKSMRQHLFVNISSFVHSCSQLSGYVNDPSAGSPTETLLRLLPPLNDQV